MAEYYNNQFGSSRSRNTRKRSSIWLTLLDIVISIISVVTALALLITLVGRLFEPEKLWYFSLTGLIAPILYLIAIAVTLYWIIRWKWRMFLFTVVFVALGWIYVPLYYKINIGKEYGTPRYERGNIKILSYNVRFLYNDLGDARITDSVATFLCRENPDIICLQEMPFMGPEYDKIIAALSKYRHTEVTPTTDGGVICFSKYRIIDSDSIGGLCGTGKGIRADLKIGEDTVRLYNVHLQTTSIKSADRDYINNRQFLKSGDTIRVSKFADMAQRLLKNSTMRAHQVDALRHEIVHSPYPVIICGDFNDVPLSYTYRTIASGLNDTFSEQGNGYAHTFREFFKLLRIDYILISKQFRTLSYEVLPFELSDHLPVEARVILK